MNYIPQILYLILSLIGLLVAANRHGKIDTKPSNFWTSLIAFLIVITLLIWAAFSIHFLKAKTHEPHRH